MYTRHKRLGGIGFLIIERSDELGFDRSFKGKFLSVLLLIGLNEALIRGQRLLKETEEEDADVSKSLPNSTNFEPKSPHRVPQHWSSSAVPLPNEELWFPAEGYDRGNAQ
ncbi:hypothetical protein Hdeb2414_s0020g00562741 [Helianthus debilis subsp. tardiflorus]